MPRSKQEIIELTEKLSADYRAGMTLAQLEVRYDVAASHIGRLLRRAGVELRPPASGTPIRRASWHNTTNAQVREYRQRLQEQGPAS